MFVIVMFFQFGLSIFQVSRITFPLSRYIFGLQRVCVVDHHHVLYCIICYVISNRVLDTCGKDGNNSRIFSFFCVSLSLDW